MKKNEKGKPQIDRSRRPATAAPKKSTALPGVVAGVRPAEAEGRSDGHEGKLTQSRLTELEAMIRQIEAKAAALPDSVAALVTILRLVVASEADSHLIIDALIEGIATTLEECIPLENQAEVAVQTLRSLRDRLATRRII